MHKPYWGVHFMAIADGSNFGNPFTAIAAPQTKLNGVIDWLQMIVWPCGFRTQRTTETQ